MVLYKKQILVIFLRQLQNNCKGAKTTHNIINTFSPGTAKKYGVQWWFQKFYREQTRALKMYMIVDYQKLPTTNQS